MSNKVTVLIDNEYQNLTVVGTNMIQVQVEQDDTDGFIDLSRDDARELARVLLEHCGEE